MSLLVSEGGNSRKYLPLKKLEGGSTPGGDVAHFGPEARGVDGCDGVSPPDDGDGSPGRRGLGQHVGHSECADGELGELEHAHGAVPHDGLRGFDDVFELSDGPGADVEAHALDGVDGARGGFGVLRAALEVGSKEQKTNTVLTS